MGFNSAFKGLIFKLLTLRNAFNEKKNEMYAYISHPETLWIMRPAPL